MFRRSGPLPARVFPVQFWVVSLLALTICRLLSTWLNAFASVLRIVPVQALIFALLQLVPELDVLLAGRRSARTQSILQFDSSRGVSRNRSIYGMINILPVAGSLTFVPEGLPVTFNSRLAVGSYGL